MISKIHSRPYIGRIAAGKPLVYILCRRVLAISTAILWLSRLREGQHNLPAYCRGYPFGLTAVRFRWRALGTTPSVATMPDTEETKAQLDELESEIEQRKVEYEQLREKMVATPAVERVLLEYGLDTEDVDVIMNDIEAVDNRLWGGDDE